MCGIVGIVQKEGESVSHRKLYGSAELLKRRGPDDSGVWIQSNVGLGHRRLSILDPSIAAHQPMCSSGGRYVIVHNGEIYNFRQIRKRQEFAGKIWRSESDTEVILAAYEKWGPDCLSHFHGMFAFAIWDTRNKTLFVARDRMGVKPLYYSVNNGFVFASRPRALFKLDMTLSKGVDAQALRFYIESGFIPAPYSIHRSIRKLPPAHYLIFEQGKALLVRYWNLQSIEPNPSWTMRSEDELLDELEDILDRTISSRMISDVPLGAFLSGGIDSSLVVAMMQRHSHQPIKTFTIGFHDKKYDESKHAEQVANYLGTEHYCERLNVNDLLKLFPIFIEEFDEPFFDSSAFPMMAVSQLARQHVTVCLSGDGGDELFGGYRYYGIINKVERCFRFPQWIRKIAGCCVAGFPNHQMKLLGGMLMQPTILSAFVYSRSIAKDFKTVLGPNILNTTVGIMEWISQQLGPFICHHKGCEQGMRVDSSFVLPDEYLQKVDVASMAFSLEAREPLLDQDLVEWATKLPVGMKLRGKDNKYLFRKLAYRYIPQSLLDRPKQGFGVPIDQWLRGPLRNWAEAIFHEKNLIDQLSLRQDRILELWDLHLSNKRQVQPLLWALLMLLEFQATMK